MFRSQPQVAQRLGPHVAALVMFSQAGVTLMHFAFRMLLQPFRHRSMQQHATGQTDVAIHHFSHLVVIEVVAAAFLILAQKPTLHQRIDAVQKAFLGGLGQC